MIYLNDHLTVAWAGPLMMIRSEEDHDVAVTLDAEAQAKLLVALQKRKEAASA